MEIKEKIIDVLRKVYDPELPVNVYDLGLIYDITIVDSHATIVMTLTSPNCPVAGILPEQVKNWVETVEEIKTATVEITFEPPWNHENLSDEVKLDLGLL